MVENWKQALFRDRPHSPFVFDLWCVDLIAIALAALAAGVLDNIPTFYLLILAGLLLFAAGLVWMLVGTKVRDSAPAK